MKLFDFKHLSTVKETYWQHLAWALYSVGTNLYVAIITLIHGLLPFVLANYPDRILVKYIERFQARRRRTGQSHPESV